MKKVIISLFLIMIIISLTSAQNSLPGISTSKNTCVNLQQTISNATTCIITVQLPLNNSPIIENQSMIKSGDIYNYNFCNTSISGDYIIITQCDPNGNWDNPVPYTLTVTTTGKELSGGYISVYIFFLLMCLMITIFSVRLMNNNSIKKDEMKSQDLYELKKRNEFKFYLQVLKKKLWIIGLFGLYLSILLFISLLNQLVFTIGLSELNNILNITVQILGWGLIPFIIFWIAYIIIYLYKSTEEILKHQFGGFR